MLCCAVLNAVSECRLMGGERLLTCCISACWTLHLPVAVGLQVDGHYFNGRYTIERKTRYAIDQGLAGVMIWESGQDCSRCAMRSQGGGDRDQTATLSCAYSFAEVHRFICIRMDQLYTSPKSAQVPAYRSAHFVEFVSFSGKKPEMRQCF